MQHQEDYTPDASEEAQYFESYADLGVHETMLRDRQRMEFYKSLLTDLTIVGSKVIVDVGSGTGILSCWAAQAGAAHVLSIEGSSMAEVQRTVIADNNLSDRITIIASTVEEIVAAGVEAFLKHYPCVQLHGGVELVVSEWMGFYLFHEFMLPSVIRMRDFLNAVNDALGSSYKVHMIPSHGHLFAAPLTLKPHYIETFASFWDCVDGVRLGALGRMAYEERIEFSSPMIDVIPQKCLLHKGEVFWSGCFDTLTVDSLADISATRTFDFSESAPCVQTHLDEAGRYIVDGFTLWFQVRYGDTVLDTSPCAPPTHWKQTTVLLPRDVRDDELVSFEGIHEKLELRLRLSVRSMKSRSYQIEFEMN